MGKIIKNGIEYGGGGGGSGTGGHVIVDTDGSPVADEPKLQFTGLDVSDNSTDSETEVAAFGLNADSLDDVITSANVPANPMVTNGLVYSTTEQVVGRWIDGKPLYQKTARYTITSRAEATILNMPIDLANLDSVVNVWGTGSWSGGYYLIPLGTGSSTVGTVTFGAVTSTYAQLRISGNQAISAGEVITFTVQYTKTTD